MAPASTYSGDPARGTVDAVRSMLGDTGGDDNATWLLTDAEITYFDSLTDPVFKSPVMTAAVCADIIAGRFAGEVSISADGVSVSGQQLQDKYTQLAASLRQLYKTISAAGGLPLVGGIDAFRIVDRTVAPFNFGVGMHDNRRAGYQTNPDNDDWYYAVPESEPW